MKFVDIPEFNEKGTVYSFNNVETEVRSCLSNLEYCFADCSDCIYFDDVEMIRFYNEGDVIVFTYLENDKKAILFDRDSAEFTIAICDKNIFDFLKSQILKNIEEDNDEEIIIPKLNNLKLKSMDNDLRYEVSSTFVYQYVRDRLEY